ncbi:MAG: hypothetical protein EXR24_04580 [Ignavibacteria bacterium]|nr:hypothetical protein [Bacteroidota bacterium]MSQ46237.1 hypothetical protein [Ignavibacteria bacterium]
MALIKNTKCKKCGKSYKWKIERPGDGFWDRWRNDDGNIIANWFVTNSLCWDHAFEVMPKEFVDKIKTVEYVEE